MRWRLSRVADSWNSGPFVASNWAMATFLVISTGSWYGLLPVHYLFRGLMGLSDRVLCQKAKRDEFTRVHRAMNSLPPRTLKKDDGTETQND